MNAYPFLPETQLRAGINPVSAWPITARGIVGAGFIPARFPGSTGENILMARKPTHEELKQKVKELEKKSLERKRVEDALL